MARNHVNDVPVRPDHFGPASYYPRRVDVGIRGVAAREAHEQVAGLSVGLLGVAANAALSRGVSRVDVADRKPDTRGLVGDLRLEIAKGPRVQDASLRPGSPYPHAYAVEVLEGDPARGAFGRGDDLLGDTVIHMRGEATLLEPPFAKQPLRALRPFALKLSPEPIGASAKAIQVGTGEVLAVARGGNVHDADVNAEPTEDLLLLDVRDLNGDEEVELRTAHHEVCFASFVGEERALMLTADERDGLPPQESPEAGRIDLPGQDACVVRDRPERAESSPRLPVQLVGVRHLGGCAHDHLRGQVGKGCAGFDVGDFVQRELAEDLLVPSLARDPVACLVRAPHRGRERLRLIGRRPKFHLHDKLHHPGVAHSSLDARPTRWGFLPALKDGVSAPEIR